ncbi:MAG: carboxylesterase family protein [Lachnospiraceae bacterium]|nr:carboxylesterase family protein [Lachnospiraceae bacterium]
MIRTAATENGIVRGLPADDPRVTVFRGIPFAAPPTGDNRWRAPQPAENWEGERKCYEFGPISMQDQPGVGDDLYSREWHVDPDIPISEDSLYLNVWTGAKNTDEKLPILVWIYGGAFQWGYTSEMEFNGERLARHGVIVVSIAYRLGVFGFLAHPELTAQDAQHPANFGLLDVQAGLSWVYRNIEAFGGDRNSITLAGQSAGGAAVTFTLANPANTQMIRRASVFSGLIRNPFMHDGIIEPGGLETAERNGEEFLKFIGCANIDEARQMDAIVIRDKYAEYAKNHPRFVPCLDGKYVKADPFGLLISGDIADVPFFAGYTNDEFLWDLPRRADMSDEQKSLIKADVIEKSGTEYFNVVQNSVRTAADAHKTNGLKEPLYVYRFAPSVPGYDNPGAFHSCDLWFFFETIQKCWRPFDGLHYALARRMCDYWTNFIRTGDPNGTGYDGEVLPKWDPSGKGSYDEYEMVFSEK